jgi:hypothetical protein
VFELEIQNLITMNNIWIASSLISFTVAFFLYLENARITSTLFLFFFIFSIIQLFSEQYPDKEISKKVRKFISKITP